MGKNKIYSRKIFVILALKMYICGIITFGEKTGWKLSEITFLK